MPDPQRPSSAPLSDSEADRLSERFTASWDDPELGDEPAQGQSEAALAETVTTTEPAGSTTAPLPAVVTAGKPKPTLLGIAPIVIGPAPPPPAPPTPLPAPVQKAATPLAALAEPSVPAPPPSSPESSVARGLTTPSKPYIPKDDPSTPAVVISDAALQPPPQPSPNRARIAQTIPGQTRSNPIAAPLPLTPPLAAPAEVDDDTYPPGRSRSKLPLALGVAAVLAVVAIGATQLGRGKAGTASSRGAAADVTPAASAPPPAVTPVTTPSPPEAPPRAAPEREAVKAPEPAVAALKTNKAVAKKPAPLRKTTKSESKSEPKSSAAEPPAPKPKGVIVRETPF